MKRILWKIIWIIGTIIACALWFLIIGFIAFGISMAANIVTHSNTVDAATDIWVVVAIIGWVGLVILSIILWKRWNFRCQVCKRWGALVLVKTELARQEKISVLMEMEHRDWQGNVTGHHDQYIPGKRKIFADSYKCKFCGNLETRIRTRESADI